MRRESGSAGPGSSASSLWRPASRTSGAGPWRKARSSCPRGSVGHSHLTFYRDAIDAKLDDGDWDGVERYAGLLEDFTRDEPYLWSTFFAARGRALAAWGRGRRDAEALAELRRLREAAERTGFMTAIPALEAALGQAESPAAVSLP